MTHRATVRCQYETPEIARTIERAIERETGTIDDDRSRTSVDRDGATVLVRIVAEDPRALRAAKRTWCSLLRVAEGSIAAASAG